MIKINCKECNKEFYVKNCIKERTKFCSVKCYGESMKGKTSPWMNKGIELTRIRNIENNVAKRIDVRKKMSLTRKERMKNRKIINWTEYGIPQNVRDKMSNSNKNYLIKNPELLIKKSERMKKDIKDGTNKTPCFKSGKENWAYVHGLSNLPYPVIFRDKLKNTIRENYNNNCIMCNKQGKKKLAIHHIDYNKNNCEINNLIPLCNSCHQITNTKNKRKYFTWQFNIYKKLFN